MLRAKEQDAAGPKLFERVLESGCRRIAILGLHARAGTRTVLATLIRELHEQDKTVAVTSFPRSNLADVTLPEPTTRVALPAGAWLANSAETGRGEAVELELTEETRFEGSRGPIGISRVTQGGELEIYGPEDAGDMRDILSRLADVAAGTVLVDGGWGRRAFASPSVTDGVVLVVGAGYSPTPERSAAAVRYLLDVFALPETTHEARLAWENAAQKNQIVLVDDSGEPMTSLPPSLAPGPAADAIVEQAPRWVVLPSGLNDELLAPLVRTEFRCTLVVRDATRVNGAPVYLRAWTKAGGNVEVVDATRVIGVATNPVNATGPDADGRAFHRMVAEQLPDVPVHDVVLESSGKARRPVWKFWER